MRAWPRWVTLGFSLMPVAALTLIIVITFVQSLPALQQVGLGRMFGADLATPMSRAPRVQYGLLAPLWGTLVVAVEAMLVALPTVVCFAIIAREFQIPVLSRIINAVIGALGGIPPVIYALSSVFFLETFMRPKLAAWDLQDARAKALLQGTPQYTMSALPIQLPNSTLLAGVLLALLIIPFMAPLVDDAFRGVPADLKRGSYALGATRWQTLWRMVIPHALPGIIAAVGLGTLVGMGEVLIPSFVLGGAENPVTMPKPPWNVLTHTPTLSSAAASMRGALTLGDAEGNAPMQISMAYASSLFLLAFAFLVMAAETIAQRHLQKGRQ